MSKASAVVSHPRILWAAWLRIDRWYRTGNLAPQPELARWRLHPEAELRLLRNELMDKAWKPSPWPQVPYPKKGASLRHYVMPSVKDQVAFMAYLVLLAPLFDNDALSFVFGNRWYRPMYWDRRSAPACWKLRPYPLLTPHIYRSYAQSFGLFRRVAHWTVARMTDTEVPHKDYGGRVRHPCDYAHDMLPPWTRSDWWKTSSRQACWVALDLQMAYPSVEIANLRESMLELLGAENPTTPPHELELSGYPAPVLDVLDDRATRQDLAKCLCAALEQVCIDSDPIAQSTWKPNHARPELPPYKDYGLPTGLAVSGILLNVVLRSADHSVRTYLESKRQHNPGAIVRFADDVYLMSTRYDDLFALTEKFWHALSQNDTPSLANPSSRTNLHLSLAKIRPTVVRETVQTFLTTNRWQRCEVQCGELIPPGECGTLTTLSTWWRQNKDRDDTLAKLRPALDRSIVLPNDLGPFVTALVERLSDIGTDNLADRFGTAATNRLERLHELARFDIDDEQVRADTRRTFAANRLVRMWLPPQSAPDAIKEIRNSIAHVLQLSPWKHALWRAVVRASTLRPHGQRSADERETDDDRSRKWLMSQLRRIAKHRDGTEPKTASWTHTWPESCMDEGHERQGNWQGLYLSYHRTVFWHEVASTLGQLWRHVTTSSRPDYVGPSPNWWTTRAIPDGSHCHAIDFLGAVDNWVEVLYPGTPHSQYLHNWELDQLCMAVLASRSRSVVAKALRSCRKPDSDMLRVPTGLSGGRIRSAVTLLRAHGRMLPVVEEDPGIRKRDSLAHIALGGQDQHLGQQLFGIDDGCTSETLDKRFLVSAAVHLGCIDDIDDGLLWHLLEDEPLIPSDVVIDPTMLMEYHRVRRAAMGRPRKAR